MSTLWQDMRYGLRMLRKAPGFTAIALVTLAVGIGANAIMFSISDTLLLRPQKMEDPEQLVYCGIQGDQFSWFRYPAYLELRDSGLAFRDVMGQANLPDTATLAYGNSARHVQTLYVSANYFSFLGVAPVRGRDFLPEEERPGSTPIAVLSHHLWQRLGADPQLVGQFLDINGISCQVVGIAPAGFTGVTLDGPDLWLPLGNFRAVGWLARQPNAKVRDYPFLDVVGRLKPGVTMRTGQAQLQALMLRFKQEYPKDWENRASFSLFRPGRFRIDGDSDETRLTIALFSLALMVASGIILVIACLNLANMLIVQGTARRREIAVRLALGGGRRRIVRQLFTESAVLAVLGGGLGVLLAFAGMRMLNAWIAGDPTSQRIFQSGLDLRVLAATVGFCLIATLLFGLRPALWLSRRDIAGAMKASAGNVLGAFRRTRDALSVAGQITLAVVLVLSATLLTRSALYIAQPDPRFNLQDKLIVTIDPLSSGYDKAQSVQVCRSIADHLASLPNVQAVGTSTRALFGGGHRAEIRGYAPKEGESGSKRALGEGAVTEIGRDYFRTLEIPLLQGRLFDGRDYAPNAEKVAIVDESLARKIRPDGQALDCFVQWGLCGDFSESCRIVGIVAHMSEVGERQAEAKMYRPIPADNLASYLYLHIAGGGSADALRGPIAEEIHRIDPRLPVLSVATLAQQRDKNSSIWLARFGARLGLSAGAAALFLAALGIYAIKGYTVAARTSEIGIRKALGATHGSIIGMVLREGLLLTTLGLMVGLGLGLVVARVAARLLYGISPLDPVSIVATVTLLGAAALLAGYLPARRAAKIDPMEALRYE